MFGDKEVELPDDIRCLLVGVNVVVPITFGGLDEPLDKGKLIELEFNFILVGVLALLTFNFTLFIMAFSFCTFGSELITLVPPATPKSFNLPLTESFTWLLKFGFDNGLEEFTMLLSENDNFDFTSLSPGFD